MLTYRELVREVLETGSKREDRTGKGTRALFGEQLKFNLEVSFPWIQIRKLSFKTCAAELEGFLKGCTDASKYNTRIWDANAKNWDSPRKTHEYDMGRVYGAQWREWYTYNNDGFGNMIQEPIDQLSQVVESITNNPHSRRHVVTAWQPAELDEMCLPPCHIMFQFQVEKEYLNCMFTMRSVDVMVGLPFDIGLYALLTHIVANQTGLKPGILTVSLGDTHIYLPHIENARRLIRRPVSISRPQLILDEAATIDNFKWQMAKLINYNPHESMKFEMFV